MLDGQKIVLVTPHYEHLLVVDDKGNKYFMTYEELLPMFTEFLFETQVKRVRTHLHPITPEVELLYDQKTYDECNV
jgi:hypothetical protein